MINFENFPTNLDFGDQNQIGKIDLKVDFEKVFPPCLDFSTKIGLA